MNNNVGQGCLTHQIIGTFAAGLSDKEACTYYVIFLLSLSLWIQHHHGPYHGLEGSLPF